MNGVQTRFKCKLDVKRCKRFVFPPSSLLPRSNALKTKAIRYFQTDRTLTRIVSPPLNDRQFTEINKGKRFPAKFDNRHKFNIIANWKIKPKLELTGSWTYATGNRLTVSFENYQAVSPQHPFPGGSLVPPYIDPGGLDYYTERNNFQLPAYHRLDLGINIYRPKKKNRMGIWNISIYNVYSYMAPVSIRKGWWYNNDCFYTLGIVPIIPSVSYTYKF